MEANRTCTLPEITSSPLKIKCYTLILILLPRLYLFMSLTTPKWNYDLVCTAWTHTELPRLVWKAMHHVGLYSADFVICSNPQRIRNKRHSVFMLYSPATYPHQTWVLPREIAEIQKNTRLFSVADRQIQFVTLEGVGTESSQEAKPEASEAQSGDQIETRWRQRK